MIDEADILRHDIALAQRPPDSPRPPRNAYQAPMQRLRRRFDVIAGPIFTECHMSAPFDIRSVRVDNGTTQWLQMGSEMDFIPPYTYGRIFNVRGVGSVDIVPSLPRGAGIQQGLGVGDYLIVTLFDRPQMPSYGTTSVVGSVNLQ